MPHRADRLPSLQVTSAPELSAWVRSALQYRHGRPSSPPKLFAHDATLSTSLALTVSRAPSSAEHFRLTLPPSFARMHRWRWRWTANVSLEPHYYSVGYADLRLAFRRPGRWRCKELFPGGRKTCLLSHARNPTLDEVSV